MDIIIFFASQNVLVVSLSLSVRTIMFNTVITCDIRRTKKVKKRHQPTDKSVKEVTRSAEEIKTVTGIGITKAILYNNDCHLN